MSSLVMDRRAVLEAAAGLLVAAGVPVGLSAAVPFASDAESARMIAAWVLLRPEAGAAVRLAWLDGSGRLLGELPAVRLVAGRADRPASLWRQAQEAGVLAQMLAMSALASAWGVRSVDCEIRGPASSRTRRAGAR